MPRRFVILVSLLCFIAACSDRPTLTSPKTDFLAAISDGAHSAGNPDFFFLPPLQASPRGNANFDRGRFNPNLSPTVKICDGRDLTPQGECVHPLLKAGQPVVFSAVRGWDGLPDWVDAEQYHVVWQTRNYNLVLGRPYRIVVKVGSTLLGFLDLVPTNNLLGALRLTAGGVDVGWLKDLVVPIRFRIEQGALCADHSNQAECTASTTVGAAPGTAGDTTIALVLPSGHAAVSLPPGAVGQGDTVTITIEKQAPPYLMEGEAQCLPTDLSQSKGCYRFNTDPPRYQFHTNVRMEICVDAEGLDPDALRLFKYNTTDHLVQLPWLDPTLIDCTGFVAMGPTAAPSGFAARALHRLGSWAVQLFAPQPLYATVFGGVPKGVGGGGGSFSDFGAAVPAEFDCNDAIGVTPAECEALKALYNSTGGPNWTDHTNWLQTYTPCTWHGVNCPNEQLRELHLGYNNLTGTLPEALGDLQHLRMLHLYGNHLSGPIPGRLGYLGQLEEFIANGNQLSGPIPWTLGYLSQLRILSLNDNQLSGQIPDSLGRLTQLQVLALDHNQLSGAIPGLLGELSNLTALVAQWNHLDGLVPLSVAQLGGRIEQANPGSCELGLANHVYLAKSPEYRAADLNGDSRICGVDTGTVAIIDVIPPDTFMVIEGSPVWFMATLQNATGAVQDTLRLQAWISQGSTAGHSAGYSQITCGGAVYALPNGGCAETWPYTASNLTDGWGTLVAGPATIKFTLQYLEGPAWVGNWVTVDSVVLPVNLIAQFHYQGSLSIPQTDLADLDEGVLTESSELVDVWFSGVTDAARFLEPVNGTRAAIFGTTAPGLQGCLAMTLSTDRIRIQDLPEGTFVCWETNNGRISEIQILQAPGPSLGTLVIGIRTFN